MHKYPCFLLFFLGTSVFGDKEHQVTLQPQFLESLPCKIYYWEAPDYHYRYSLNPNFLPVELIQSNKYTTGFPGKKYHIMESNLYINDILYFYYIPDTLDKNNILKIKSPSNEYISYNETQKNFAQNEIEIETVKTRIQKISIKYDTYRHLLQDEQTYRDGIFQVIFITLLGPPMGVLLIKGDQEYSLQKPLGYFMLVSGVVYAFGTVKGYFSHKKKIKQIETLKKELTNF